MYEKNIFLFVDILYDQYSLPCNTCPKNPKFYKENVLKCPKSQDLGKSTKSVLIRKFKMFNNADLDARNMHLPMLGY